MMHLKNKTISRTKNDLKRQRMPTNLKKKSTNEILEKVKNKKDRSVKQSFKNKH